MNRTFFIVFSLLALSSTCFSQVGKVYTLRNCQSEDRTVTFQEQVTILWKCVAGWTNLRDQRILRFSPDYKLDSSEFNSNISRIKKLLPVNFFKGYEFLGPVLENKPDEKAIWFTQVYAQKNSKGDFQVYAAIRVTFNGNDARVDSQRKDPRIVKLEFVYDKSELVKLALKLKSSPEFGKD